MGAPIPVLPQLRYADARPPANRPLLVTTRLLPITRAAGSTVPTGMLSPWYTAGITAQTRSGAALIVLEEGRLSPCMVMSMFAPLPVVTLVVVCVGPEDGSDDVVGPHAASAIAVRSTALRMAINRFEMSESLSHPKLALALGAGNRCSMALA